METETAGSSPAKRGRGTIKRAQRAKMVEGAASDGDVGALSALSTTSLRSAVPLPRSASLTGEEPTEPALAQRIVEAARHWIGTPYVHQASARGAGCDCLGLLRGVWRDIAGGEPESVPPYSADWAEASGREEMYGAFKRHFAEIDTAGIAPGDIALFRMLPWGPAKHCAIVARRFGRLTLIHSRANTKVTEEPMTAAWQRRLAFAFRL